MVSSPRRHRPDVHHQRLPDESDDARARAHGEPVAMPRVSNAPGASSGEAAGEPRTLIDVVGRVLLDERAAEPERLALRVVLLLAMIAWTWSLAFATIASNAVGQSFLHLINLPFHEAGHILFMPFGGFMMSLGGSLNQLLIPSLLTIVFLTRHRDPFGAAMTCWWLGENLLDLAPYIDDARALQLVLIGGKTGAEVEGHDWERILDTLGWLHRDHALARLAQFSGAVIMLFACAWGVTLVIRHWQRLGTGEPAGDEPDWQ
jgi:hypothetical protein